MLSNYLAILIEVSPFFGSLMLEVNDFHKLLKITIVSQIIDFQVTTVNIMQQLQSPRAFFTNTQSFTGILHVRFEDCYERAIITSRVLKYFM